MPSFIRVKKYICKLYNTNMRFMGTYFFTFVLYHTQQVIAVSKNISRASTFNFNGYRILYGHEIFSYV